MALTFGIEIECFMPPANLPKLAEKMTAAGVPCRYVGRYHSGVDRAFWKIETDISIRPTAGYQSLELISPPLVEGDEGFEKIAKTCAVLAELDANVNRSCGLHVHVGIRDTSVAAVRKLAQLWVQYEDLIDGLIPPSRRGNNNDWCKAVATVVNARRLNRARTIEEVAMAVGSRWDRRYKLNLSSYWKYQTVEFRNHSGTVDPEKIIKWVGFCTKMVESAIRTASEEAIVQRRVDVPYGTHWRKGRTARLLYAMLTRPEGVTGEELRLARGIATRPGIRWHLNRAGAPINVVGRRDGHEVFRLDAENPTQVVTTAATPKTFDDLYETLQLSAADKAFWQERQRILSGQSLQRSRPRIRPAQPAPGDEVSNATPLDSTRAEVIQAIRTGDLSTIVPRPSYQLTSGSWLWRGEVISQAEIAQLRIGRVE